MVNWSDLIDSIVRENRSVLSEPNGLWGQAISEVTTRRGLHIAVFVEPYLGFVLNGTKTIESRFSKNKIAPFEQVTAGDLVLLKSTGGPIVGVTEVRNTWYYKLTPTSLVEIQDLFGAAICADGPAFWEQREAAHFASLMSVGTPLRIKPHSFQKRDRRGWIVLKPSCEKETQYTLPFQRV